MKRWIGLSLGSTQIGTMGRTIRPSFIYTETTSRGIHLFGFMESLQVNDDNDLRIAGRGTEVKRELPLEKLLVNQPVIKKLPFTYSSLLLPRLKEAAIRHILV